MARTNVKAPAPKPDPEVEKLHVWVGRWKYEGEYEAGPLGPAGKHTGQMTCQMILGGFFLQGKFTEKGPMGEWQGLPIWGYDSANKNYPHQNYVNNGIYLSGVFTVSGNTWTWAAKWPVGEKQYQIRGTYTFAADLKSVTDTAEISADGQTWTPLRKGKWTKAKPAPKK